MPNRIFTFSVFLALTLGYVGMTLPGCGSSKANTQLETWASQSYECPDGTEIVSVHEPATGRWCEKDDGQKHGREVWHHKNLVKAAEVLWVDGKKHLLERWWRPEGLKHLQTAWVRGGKHGLEIRWTQKGGFGNATCYLSNEHIWSTSNVVEAQTRTCIEPEKEDEEPTESDNTESDEQNPATASAGSDESAAPQESDTAPAPAEGDTPPDPADGDDPQTKPPAESAPTP